jgi:hypothetical protein
MSNFLDTSLIDRFEMSPDSRAFALDVLKKLHNAFGSSDFRFDPEPHEYYLGDTKLTSATTFIKRFEHEFDREAQLPKSAAKRKMTVEELGAEWDATRDRACELGSAVHDKIEYTYRGKLNESDLHEDEEVNARFYEFLKLRSTRLNTLIPLALEARMYIEKWGLSGTLDALFLLGDTLQLFVGDWKTNGEFTTEDDYAFNMLKEPFSRYKQCKLTIYSIQVSLYRIFLEEANIFTEGAFLCHIPPKGEAVIYKAKDFRPQLRKYLDEHCLISKNNVPDLAYNTNSSIETKTEWWLDPASIFGY